MLVLGLVVEGEYDAKALQELVKKCVLTDLKFEVRPVGQKGKFHKCFLPSLEEFRYANGGSHVDRALVIRDANNKDPESLEQKLQEQVQGRSYPFPLKFHVIVQELETWLLADEVAISKITQVRTGHTIPQIPGQLESIQDPKAILTRELEKAQVPYTSEVARLIAAESRVDIIEYRCPRFKKFRKILAED